MRYIIIALAILAMPFSAMSAQITFNLDRCVVLNSLSHQDADSKVALHFTLPEELSRKEVMYAELVFDLPEMRLGLDSLFEIMLFPLLSNWSENEISYDNSEAITDSMSSGAYTVKLADSNSFRIDMTNYLRETVEGERQNFGVIGVADLLGDGNLKLSENLAGHIRDIARIRVIYK